MPNPHHGIGVYKCESNDRKPNPGMIQRVMSDFNVKASELVMVGDSAVDIEAASRLGCYRHWFARGGFTGTGCGA